MYGLIPDPDTAYFYADIENRTRDLTARLDKCRHNVGPHVVHPFVLTVAKAIIDLIGYSSDSAIDEYQNSIDPYVDADDYAEAYASCGYDNELFADPTSAEYRAYCTEVDEYHAVSKHLSDAERELIKSVSNAWDVVDELYNAENGVPDNELDTVLRKWFDRVMTFAETGGQGKPISLI